MDLTAFIPSSSLQWGFYCGRNLENFRNSKKDLLVCGIGLCVREKNACVFHVGEFVTVLGFDCIFARLHVDSVLMTCDVVWNCEGKELWRSV